MNRDKLSNHVPRYPDPEIDPDYNRRIFNMHEYRIHRGDKPQQNTVYLNHQRLTQVHLGWSSPNRRLFIFKPPGVGKTCDTIGVAETRHYWLRQVLKTDDPILSDKKFDLNKALIIAPSHTILSDNFKKDIMTTCTAGSYVTEALKNNFFKTERGKNRVKTNSINTAYELTTHTTLANQIRTKTDEEIAKMYSWRVIIIDEIHELNTYTERKINKETGEYETRKKRKNYEPILRLMNNVYGCVIIGITATPIRDDIIEFPSVINLILEPHLRVDEEYWRQLVKMEDLDQLKAKMEEYLVPKLMGKISWMKTPSTSSRTVIRTNMKPNDKILAYSDKQLWLSVVDNNLADSDVKIDYRYILETYWRIVAGSMDSQTTKFYIDGVFADNMIFPTPEGRGDAGSHAIKANVIQGQPGVSTFRFADSFLTDFARQMTNSRMIFIAVAEAEISDLKRRRNEFLSINPNADVDEIDEKIEEKGGTIDAVRERLEDHPGGTYDINNDLDIYTMLYTIRSRYSPVYADTIEQIIGIEYYNELKQKYEYHATSETNSFNYERFDPKDTDNRECAYVFNEYLPGGIAPLGLFLNMFGYEELRIESTEASYISSDGNRIIIPRHKRYALLYASGTEEGSTGKTKKSLGEVRLRKILALFNHPENRYGHYLKVVAGTEVTAQSINFKNVRQAHYTYRGWNEASIIQAEGRVDRPGGSHQAFADTVDDRDPMWFDDGAVKTRYGAVGPLGWMTSPPEPGRLAQASVKQKYVKIFRHIAYYPSLNRADPKTGVVSNITVGLKMYDDSAEKDIKPILVRDILKRVSYDFVLNSLVDGTLDGIPYAFQDSKPADQNRNGENDQNREDYTTYNIFYARREIERIKCSIRGHLGSYFTLTLNDLIGLHPQSNKTTIIKALTEMVNDNERVLDRHGMLNYIREEKDIFFLQKSPSVIGSTGQRWMSYYSERNYVQYGTSMDKLADKIDREESNSTLFQLEVIPPNDTYKINDLLNQLSAGSLKMLVEGFVVNHRFLTTNRKINRNTLDHIFTRLFPRICFAPNNKLIIHAFEYYSQKEAQQGGKRADLVITAVSSNQLRIFDLEEQTWRNSTATEDQSYKPFINSALGKTKNEKMFQFSESGISVVGNGVHAFNIHDNLVYEAAKSSITQKEIESRRDQVKTGTIANKHKPMLIYYLFNVKIDVLVQIRIFPPYKTRRGAIINPIIMYKLKRDPNGNVIANINKEIIRCSYHLNLQGSSIYVSNCEDIAVNIPWNSHIKEIYMHYTHVYPEMFGWIFEDALKNADKNFMNSSNVLFYPTYLSGQAKDRVYPLLAKLLDGDPYYSSVLEALPAGYLGTTKDRTSILTRFTGDLKGADPGEIKLPNFGDKLAFYPDGLIAGSLNLLYREIANDRLQEKHEINHENTKKVTKSIPIQGRFWEIYNRSSDRTGNQGMLNRDLESTVYLLHYLRESIEFL